MYVSIERRAHSFQLLASATTVPGACLGFPRLLFIASHTLWSSSWLIRDDALLSAEHHGYAGAGAAAPGL